MAAHAGAIWCRRDGLAPNLFPMNPIPPPQPPPADAGRLVPPLLPLSSELQAALQQAIKRLQVVPARMAVGVSGGVDSAMLAVHASAVARIHGIELMLFHVHHGLQEAADGWAEHVVTLGKLLDTPVHIARVRVQEGAGQGIEAAARDARYLALSDLAQGQRLTHILLAHHRHDQAETVLLRLLRGTGPQGMAAMAARSTRDGITYLRPWLDMDRGLIQAIAVEIEQASGWRAVLDPTNADPRYTRAALRELLAPALDTRWPGWRSTLARHARHMADALEVLEEVARTDLASLEPSPDQGSFSLAAWRTLSPVRQAQVLRHWMQINGAQAPTEARMQDLLRQLRQLHSLGHDRQLRVEQAGHVVRCHRGRVWIEPRL